MSKKEEISWSDFEKIDIRAGKVLTAVVFEKARKPAYQLSIDFGPLGVLKSSAQITEHYAVDDLPGKTILAVVNFPSKQIANFMSECLILGVLNPNGVVLLTTDKDVEPGGLIG